MKTSRILLLLGLLPVLNACGEEGMFKCAPRHVNLTTNSGTENAPTILQIKPDTIVVKDGCPFDIKFQAGRTVSTKSNQAWLTKGETTVSPIKFDVPDGQAPLTYKYEVIVKEFGTLDPRARVKN